MRSAFCSQKSVCKNKHKYDVSYHTDSTGRKTATIFHLSTFLLQKLTYWPFLAQTSLLNSAPFHVLPHKLQVLREMVQ